MVTSTSATGTSSILTTLGVGSGIDSPSLVANLVAAARSNKDTQLTDRTTRNTAQLSALAQMSSDLAGLSSAANQRLIVIEDKDIAQFVRDFVDTFNSIRTEISSATAIGTGTSAGPLVSDPGVRTLSRAMSGLAGSEVNAVITAEDGTTSSGAFTRLSQIGISTGRDGKLMIDETKLAAAIRGDVASVRALLGAGDINNGLAGALKSLNTMMTSSNGPLAVSQSRYQRDAKAIVTAKLKLDDQMTAMSQRLMKTFSAMDLQVAAIKASQAYLDQQVKLWTKSN